jgi:hypothetical protein
MSRTVNQASHRNHIPSASAGLAIVELSNGHRSYGLYRVKRYEARSIVLDHGAFAFPVGMHLNVEDYSQQLPRAARDSAFQQRATVVESDREGIRLVW